MDEQFQNCKFLVFKIKKKYNLKHSKNLHFGKIQKIPISKIPNDTEIFKILEFKKLKIPYFVNFINY